MEKLGFSPVFYILILCVFAGCALFLYLRLKILSKKYDAALARESEFIRFMKIFSKSLKSAEEIEDTMNDTARHVADLVSASSVCIFIEEKGFLKATGICGAFPPLHKSQDYILTKPRYILESLRREKIRIGEGLIGDIALKKNAVLIENAAEHPLVAAIDSVIPIETIMAAPLVTESRLIGVICAVNNRKDGEPFSLEQFNTFKFMAGQVVLAYNIMKVYADLSRQQRIDQEIEFARQLQASLLPKEYPENASYSIHAFNRAAKEIGGDFYDFVPISNGKLLVVIGDACGKGIPACMLMAMTRSFIRANVGRFDTLSSMMRDLNSALYKDTGDERFVTVACAVLDTVNKTIEYARAGHTEFIVNVPGHRNRTIYPDGVAAGLMPPEIAGEFDSISFMMQNGMTLLFFTDGITEALNHKDEEYGLARLSKTFEEACAKNLKPHEIIDHILRSLDSFTQDRQQVDDQTLVVVKCH